MVKIPTRLEDLVPAGAIEKLVDVLNQPELSERFKDALDKVNVAGKDPLGQAQQAWQQARSWLDSFTADPDRHAESAIVNATGRLFVDPSNSFSWAGLPSAATIAYGRAKTAAAFQIESVIEKKAERLPATLSAYKSTWVNQSLSALALLQSRECAPAGIVVARSDLLRVPGFGDIRSMLTCFGGQLHEVGAVNGTTESDWRNAVKNDQQLVLIVSPNGLAEQAFQQQRTAAIAAAQDAGATVVELLLDGVLSARFSESCSLPNVAEHLEQGSQVLLPTNLFLGGPEGMLVLGNGALVDQVASAATRTGAVMQGSQLAAASLAVQMAALGDEIETGVATGLMINPENLKNRCERLEIQIKGHIKNAVTEVCQREVEHGPSPWNQMKSSGWAVRLKIEDAGQEMWQALALGSESRLPVLLDQEGSDCFWVDLRFVPPEDDHEVVSALLEISQPGPTES